MSMFNDIACSQRKAIQKPDCKMNKKSEHARPNSNKDSGASWGPLQKIRVGKEISTNLSHNEMYCRIANGWQVHVLHFPIDISTDRIVIAWTYKKMKNLTISNLHINKQRLINTKVASNLPNTYNRISIHREQLCGVSSMSNPSSLYWLQKQQYTMQRAWSDSLRQRTKNHETLIRKELPKRQRLPKR